MFRCLKQVDLSKSSMATLVRSIFIFTLISVFPLLKVEAEQAEFAKFSVSQVLSSFKESGFKFKVTGTGSITTKSGGKIESRMLYVPLQKSIPKDPYKFELGTNIGILGITSYSTQADLDKWTRLTKSNNSMQCGQPKANCHSFQKGNLIIEAGYMLMHCMKDTKLLSSN